MFLLCPSRNQSLSPDRFSTTTTTFRLFSFFNQLLHTLNWKFLLKHYQSDSIKTKIWNQKITLEIQRSTQERSTTLPLSHTVYDTTTVGSRTSVILWFLTWVHSPREIWIEKRIPCSVFSRKKNIRSGSACSCVSKTTKIPVLLKGVRKEFECCDVSGSFVDHPRKIHFGLSVFLRLTYLLVLIRSDPIEV